MQIIYKYSLGFFGVQYFLIECAINFFRNHLIVSSTSQMFSMEIRLRACLGKFVFCFYMQGEFLSHAPPIHPLFLSPTIPSVCLILCLSLSLSTTLSLSLSAPHPHPHPHVLSLTAVYTRYKIQEMMSHCAWDEERARDSKEASTDTP